METSLTNQPITLTGLPEEVVRHLQKPVPGVERKSTIDIHPIFVSRPQPTVEESRNLLDQMAAQSSGQALPADFSRGDIYAEHD